MPEPSDTPPTPPERPAAPSAADFQLLADLYQRFPGLFPAMDPRNKVTVAEVIDKHLADVKGEIDPRTYENRAGKLGALREALGHRLVVDLSPLDLKGWLNANAGRWPAGWTQAGVNGMVQRAFNWALSVRLTAANPFYGFTTHVERRTGRDIKPEEFQALLRHSDPYFRRFLVALKLTGARPSELTGLRWDHIDWRRGLATLPQHKTRKKTGKPRVIVLIPQVLKLLAIIKRDQHGPAAVELRRILQHAPGRTLRAKEVVRQMKHLGFSYRAIYNARNAIGAVFERVGGWREHGHTVYRLPEGAIEQAPAAGDRVFVCSKQRPWTRPALGTKFARLRRRIGLPADCRLYGTRHLFATWAVKRGLNLKAVATLLGHATTAMVERVYAHIDGDFAYLQEAARAATALTGTPQTLPLPVEAQAWQEMLLVRYPKAKPKPPKKQRTGPRPLQEAHHVAWKAYQFALAEAPELAKATDVQLYEWLIGRREFAGQLPPSADSFRRYLHVARVHFEGMAKRKKRRVEAQASNQTPSPGEPHEQAS